MADILGVFVPHSELSQVDAALVKMAMRAPDRSYCPQSKFPVGSAVIAENFRGSTRIFTGCNVENTFYPATICAERNAVTTAVYEGYTRLLKVAVFCRKYPGGSPCGVCRQVLTQFGMDATLFNVVDHDGGVRKGMVCELLPAAVGAALAKADQTAEERDLVRRLLAFKRKGMGHAPYSKLDRVALLVARNEVDRKSTFYGAVIDNASYGASVGCENVAMIQARNAGFIYSPTLVVAVPDLHAHNPIDGECLQVLREFGRDCRILLVGPDSSIMRTSLVSLLPDSFGPEAL